MRRSCPRLLLPRGGCRARWLSVAAPPPRLSLKSRPVPELRGLLRAEGLSPAGRKAELVARLQEAQLAAAAPAPRQRGRKGLMAEVAADLQALASEASEAALSHGDEAPPDADALARHFDPSYDFAAGDWSAQVTL
jgi:hypothetical protein